MQLLAEMDGFFEPLANVKIIRGDEPSGHSRRCLLRPGRSDRIIEIPWPNEMGRSAISRAPIYGTAIPETIDFETLAARCEGATGADIRPFCTEGDTWAIP